MKTLEEQVVGLLLENKLTISFAESCTGGLLAGQIVNVPGVSTVFSEGYVTYSNNSKNKNLHVPMDLLDKFGAVSQEVASAMAEGVKNVSGADIGVSTTGLAGPDGGSKDKPVGLVYIACATKRSTVVKKLLLEGDRMSIRSQSVKKALELIIENMKEASECE